MLRSACNGAPITFEENISRHAAKRGGSITLDDGVAPKGGSLNRHHFFKDY